MNGIENHITEDLIISYLNGNLSNESQVKQVEGWLSEKKNLDTAREVYKNWEVSMLAKPYSKNIDQAFAQVSKKLDSKEGKKAISISLWWYAAASVVFIIGLIFFLQSPAEPKTITLSTLQNVEEHQLPDGTAISLNSQSSLTYFKEEISSQGERIVHLKGEAFFEVVHSPSRPFIVQTEDAEVKVLGTKFMVKSIGNAPTRVLVTEGKVQVTYLESDEVIVLEAEEEIVREKVDNGLNLVVKPSDDNQLYWKTGVMTFKEDSLGSVFQTLSQEFDTKIMTRNESILSCDITATFKRQSLETIIEVIKSTHQLESHTEGSVIIITGNGCD